MTNSLNYQDFNFESSAPSTSQRNSTAHIIPSETSGNGSSNNEHNEEEHNPQVHDFVDQGAEQPRQNKKRRRAGVVSPSRKREIKTPRNGNRGRVHPEWLNSWSKPKGR